MTHALYLAFVDWISVSFISNAIDVHADNILSSLDHPRGWKRRAPEDAADEDEPPSSRFRRGEALPSDGPDASDSDTCGSREPPDEGDDGQWNLMGAALEREFLGLDDWTKLLVVKWSRSSYNYFLNFSCDSLTHS